jgi:hypothetical protein
MKNKSQAWISVKGTDIVIRGSNKQILSAKSLLDELSQNFRNGMPGFRMERQRPTQTRKRPTVTIDSEGWTTKSSAKKSETKQNTAEPQVVDTSYSGQFAHLDVSSSDEEDECGDEVVDIDDEREVSRAIGESMQGRMGLEAVGAFSSRLPKTRSYEEIHKDIERAQRFLDTLGNSWADAADREETEEEIEQLKKELQTVDKIQRLIDSHPDM